MARLDRRARLCFMPSQRPGLSEALGLGQPELDAAAWAVTSEGALLRGPVAIAAAGDALLSAPDNTGRSRRRGLSSALSASRGPLSRLVGLPGLAAVAERAYSAVAARRGRLPFGGPPACASGVPPALDASSAAEIRRRISGRNAAEDDGRATRS